jgi:hypothetical protein
VALATVGFALGLPMRPWILPGAAVLGIAFLRGVTPSWRSVAQVAAFTAVLHCGAFLLARETFDKSYDGLAYQQEAVLRLAAGLNPLFEGAGQYGQGNELYVDHYPKASWIAGAAVLLGCGNLEAGKLFNFTLILSAGCATASALLRLTSLRVPVVAVVALLAALNPVAVYQSSTFCVDGLIASVLTVAIASLVNSAKTFRWSVLCPALLAISLLVNLKLTGLVYGVVLLGWAVVAAWFRSGKMAAARLAIPALITGLVSVGLLGYSPYVRNLREKGNIFYPVRGATKDVFDAGPPQPANIADKDRFSRFLIANFSCSQTVRRPASTRLKFPFWIAREERYSWSYYCIEAGAFGPLYGGMLVLGTIGLCLLLASAETRQSGRLVLLISGGLLASMFIHSEAWWARYAPQAWLLPLLVATAGLRTPVRSRWWCVAWAILALATVNILFVGYHYARYEWDYTRSTRRSLAEMAHLDKPIRAYVGPFRSLRRRFLEAGVEVHLVDNPAALEASSKRRLLPSAAADTSTFWQE